MGKDQPLQLSVNTRSSGKAAVIDWSFSRNYSESAVFHESFWEDTRLWITRSEVQIVASLVMRMVKTTNRVVMNKYEKEIMAERLGLSVNSIRMALSNLSKTKIMHGLGSGSYMMNPQYFYYPSHTKRLDKYLNTLENSEIRAFIADPVRTQERLHGYKQKRPTKR